MYMPLWIPPCEEIDAVRRELERASNDDLLEGLEVRRITVSGVVGCPCWRSRAASAILGFDYGV